VLTLGLMLSEGIKVSKAKAEIKPKPKTLLLVRTKKKTRKNAIVEYLDYQIPVTQLNGDMQAAKRD